MIIDYKADPEHAGKYVILDARTGQDLSHLRIFYADDERDTIRCHTVNAQGKPHLNDAGQVATHEAYRPIRIVAREEHEAAGREGADKPQFMGLTDYAKRLATDGFENTKEPA